MKKIVFCLIMAAVTLSACNINFHESYSGKPIKTETRETQSFERIQLIGSPTLYYTQGDTTSIMVEAPKDLLEYVETEVKNNCLIVRISNEAGSVIRQLSIPDMDEVKIHVTSPDLIEATLSGSGDFISNGLLDTDNLKLELKGSGDMSFQDIICDHINTTLVGSGDIKVSHVKAQTSNIELVGSGDLDIFHDGVQQTVIILKGSGDIKADFQHCGEVSGELRGSGDITLTGNVHKMQKKVLGSGDFHTNSLQVQ